MLAHIQCIWLLFGYVGGAFRFEKPMAWVCRLYSTFILKKKLSPIPGGNPPRIFFYLEIIFSTSRVTGSLRFSFCGDLHPFLGFQYSPYNLLYFLPFTSYIAFFVIDYLASLTMAAKHSGCVPFEGS